MLRIQDAIPINYKNKDEWLEGRKRTIGSSDAANVVGVGYDPPIDVWQRKLGLAPPTVENEAMLWGKLHEPTIMREYRRRTGNEPVEQLYFVNPSATWMTATVDGMCPDGRIVEIKTASSWAKDWGDEGTDEVPEPYLVQVQHQMAVTGAVVADLVVLIGGNRYRSIEVERDERLINAMFEREIEFMGCLESKRPPTWGKLHAGHLARIYTACEGETWLDADVEAAAETYAILGEELKEIEADREYCKSQVLRAMGDCQVGRLPSGGTLKRHRIEMAARTQEVKAHVRHYFTILKGR